MKRTLPVVAAIPNFNMAIQLQHLLPDVLEQEYEQVLVLDDASTDYSRDVVESFGPAVEFVAGETNAGSGGTRNRVLTALKGESLIHFLDADVRLQTTDSVEVAREIMADKAIGLGGGLVLDEQGQQSIWNYGPRQCLYSDVTAALHLALNQFPRVDTLARSRMHRLLAQWPNVSQPPAQRTTYWVHEANMLVRSSVFAQLGGFDDMVRYHDIQDLAQRSQRAGFKSVFNPAISVVQTNEVNVRSGNRHLEELKAELYIAKKNGLLEWLLPDGRFQPSYNQ